MQQREKRPIELGRHWSYNLQNDPKRLGFVLARYRFAALMCRNSRSIIELGCSEGLGVPFFKERARAYTGVDFDGDAIRVARRNWNDRRTRFIKADFLGREFGRYDAVISLDVVEHIMPAAENEFWKTLGANLKGDGVAIIGTPNLTAAAYASRASQAGHVNLFSAERLQATMRRRFQHVFVFGMNDEVVHTGFLSMAHYLFGLGYRQKPPPEK
jgi:2-polyprenyl-3-methyl-5-hydroxy-6-metoxy-1,4-benzoquinol methylase